MQGGGALIDIGSHALDLTLWLMDNYQVKAVLGTTYNVLSKQENAANLGDLGTQVGSRWKNLLLALLPWQMVPRWWWNPAGL